MSQKKDQSKKIRYCVLIGDSINTDFDSANPFAEVGNFSAIDYTINWLTQNGVEEIFLFYSNLKSQIEQYHQTVSKQTEVKISLHYMKSSELKSFGDVIRQVHFRNLLSEDFIVMYADNISNIDLSLMIENHFQKKNDLKNVVLTTALRTGLSCQIYLLNSGTNQILQIQNQNQNQFSLNVQKINLKKTNVSFRRDLVPADIYICTVDILNSFKETYEYCTMQDFIVGMLTSEVYQEKIIAYQFKSNEVSYRLSKASNYYNCYMSYICGYLYPYTVYEEDKMSKYTKSTGDRSFTVKNFNKFLKRGSSISSNSKLSHNTYIGVNSKIEDGVLLSKTIVGNNCTINKNVKLKNCIILDQCNISENACYECCLIERVGETFKIHNFKNDIFEQFQKMIERQLFLQTPSIEKVTFQEELQNLLTEKADDEAIVVSQLVRMRQECSKSEAQLTMEIIRIIKPQGLKGIESFTSQFGSVLLKVHHNDQQQLLSSLYYSCLGINDYLKAYHLILQYFYHTDIIEKAQIKAWFQNNISDTPTCNLCKPFVQKLDEESDEEEQEQNNQYEDDDK